MKLKIDGKIIESELCILAADGIYNWDPETCKWDKLTEIYTSREKFFEYSQKYFEENPEKSKEIFDIDEILKNFSTSKNSF